MIHGTEDKIVPFNSAIKLYSNSPKARTTFVKIEGGSHNNLIDFETFHNQISKFLP